MYNFGLHGMSVYFSGGMAWVCMVWVSTTSISLACMCMSCVYVALNNTAWMLLNVMCV